MSTPSTVTATLPPHQYYSHHRACQPSTASYTYNPSLFNGSTKGTGSSHQNSCVINNYSNDLRKIPTQQLKRQYRAEYSAESTRESPNMRSSAKSMRKPDWAEFYKHGIPKEVIVIDDDDGASSSVPQASARTYERPRHVNKRRRTGPSTAYDPVYLPDMSYSMTQTPYHDISSSKNTISTDRTTSVNISTAATSLGSQVSNGTYKRPAEVHPLDHRRKRTRRAAAEEAEEAKRRELEIRGDPFTNYVPPPNPPIKAKDVHVPLIPDVCIISKVLERKLTFNPESQERP